MGSVKRHKKKEINSVKIEINLSLKK